jgi:hypothetical protein
LNQKYGVLEWWALNDPTEEQINQARTLWQITNGLTIRSHGHTLKAFSQRNKWRSLSPYIRAWNDAKTRNLFKRSSRVGSGLFNYPVREGFTFLLGGLNDLFGKL